MRLLRNKKQATINPELIGILFSKKHMPNTEKKFTQQDKKWFKEGDKLAELIALPSSIKELSDEKERDAVAAIYQKILSEAKKGRMPYNEALIANLALHQRETQKNPLTGLGNTESAKLLYDQFREEQQQSTEDWSIVVVRGDADSFKAINDKLSHKAGDDMLKSIADKLKDAKMEIQLAILEGAQSAVRQVDILHFSGDEFGLILTGIKEYDTEPGSEKNIHFTKEQVVENILKRVAQKIEEIIRPEAVGGEGQTVSMGYKIIDRNTKLEEGGGTSEFALADQMADEAASNSKGLKYVTLQDSKRKLMGSERIVNFDKVQTKLEELGLTAADIAASKIQAEMERTVGNTLLSARENGVDEDSLTTLEETLNDLRKQAGEAVRGAIDS